VVQIQTASVPPVKSGGIGQQALNCNIDGARHVNRPELLETMLLAMQMTREKNG
jgi:hypothetical protein